MSCPFAEICGGCSYRNLNEADYRHIKEQNFIKTISKISSDKFRFNQPVFISDGSRRRASLAFEYKKKQPILGFNKKASHQVVNIEKCLLLTSGLNNILPILRQMISAICTEPWTEKKGKKTTSHTITCGDIFICQADNGIDIVLEYDAPISLSHHMIIAETMQQSSDIIRISHRRKPNTEAETIIEKSRPYIKIGGYNVYIPAGTFLQPSAEGQDALTNLVSKYLENVRGNIADLFCGVGTFSYSITGKSGVKITAIDSSSSLLKGFQDSLNRNQITNIEITNKNLFKYPLDENELKNFVAVIFDPPRAGAKAVCRQLASASDKPDILVAISCNPATFVNDADILLSGGYNLQEITMIDQFTYSNHSELVAFFTKNNI